MPSEVSPVNTDTECHICGARQLDIVSNYPALPRVASDCTPWRSGGKLATCKACLCVQNPVDADWHAETTRVYDRYKIYTQSAGNEQGIFADGKKPIPRSEKVFQNAMPFLDLKKTGRLLDIGCANGELLRIFGNLAPKWKMVGFEIDDKRKEEVLRIPGVEAFLSGSLEKVTQKFDIITLIHVLEHLPYPVKWLKDLHRLLTSDGVVLIQVPDPKTNPYNLLVADHCSHFVLPDLIRIAEQAGYEVVAYSDAWVAREFSILIKRAPTLAKQTDNKHLENLEKARTASYPKKAIAWLQDVIALSKTIPQTSTRGIWGTAIAATWLYSLFDGSVDFFVDEDPNRIGQQHLGKPVISPDKVPAGSTVFIALTPEIAANIAGRWSHMDAKLISPPALQY